MKLVIQRRANTVWSPLYVDSKKTKNKKKTILTDAENGPVVARNMWWMGDMGEGGQKAQTSSYKTGKSWGYNV